MTEEPNRIDFWDMAARKKHGVGDNYEWFKVTHLDEGGTRVSIAPVSRKKNGEKKYDIKNTLTTIITDEEYKAAETEYQQQTGNCPKCKGTGKVLVGWSKAGGTRYCPCPDCTKDDGGNT